jgi:hypothetical protein
MSLAAAEQRVCQAELCPWHQARFPDTSWAATQQSGSTLLRMLQAQAAHGIGSPVSELAGPSNGAVGHELPPPSSAEGAAGGAASAAPMR